MMGPMLKAAKRTKDAAQGLALLDSKTKNEALLRMAYALEQSSAEILHSNALDIEDARSASIPAAALSRMSLSQDKIEQMALSIRSVANLADPVGRIELSSELDDGLELTKITCPFGVIAAVVEARPDAIAQISALTLKSGNALMLKAGVEIGRTTLAIIDCLEHALTIDGNFPCDTITNIATREDLHELLAFHEYIDLIVPRGSAELIRFISTNTRIPVLGHADGVCHIYVDSEADLSVALPVILDSKVQAPTACNAVETVVIHSSIACTFVPALVETLSSHGVRSRGCKMACNFCKNIEPGADDEWHKEYGGMIVAIRVVDDLRDAIDHINHFGSHHTDCIITRNEATARRFTQEVDSAGIFVNASTRFADGYRYGFGAEVGISTGKLHARGPVSLNDLVTYKYVLRGTGQCVRQYLGSDRRRFKHEISASA